MEGPEEVKWELGCTGKIGLTALGLGFNHWEINKYFLKWEWNFSPSTIFNYII